MTGKESSENKLIPKENFTDWYDKVLLEAKIADDRYPVKGFTVYTGWGFSILKRIIAMLETDLEKNENQPMQFPVVIPEDAFQKEEDHIEGFSAEVFWITHAGLNELERRLVLRPTSETAIYPMFKLWMRSHQDLPIKMHQTCNVYRYETKATRPLYRGREFLWNEGHTAHEDIEKAEEEVKKAIKIYSSVYDRLGLSYITLKRPDFDKFAGADYSVAFDTWNPDGKVNQIGTVHELGYNFAKAFDLTYENPDGDQVYATTTCYGMGFGRTLAATISHHGDDHGLILPPNVAPKQVVVIPLLFKGKEKIAEDYARKITNIIEESGIRVVLDDDERLNPGDKYYKWEMFGVPLRVEIGPREAQNKTVTLARRDNFEKTTVSEKELIPKIKELFDEIFQTLKSRSQDVMDELIAEAEDLEELKGHMDERKIVKVNWCGDPECAFNIKDMVAGEVRGTRWDVDEVPKGSCILCRDEAKYVAYVSRTY
ncbi:proline--tRNA ligase [Candidatus Bathyarchaeota archaeon]|nr:proline--tRNA ligase [Candidatus Bathyarchaeota archaeon]